MAEHLTVEVGAERVPALVYGLGAHAPLLVLGHGAGAPQSSPFMVDMAEGLAARGVEVMTFDFVYTSKKKKVPDPPALLEATYRAVVLSVRGHAAGRPLFLGGKSMGGRIASQIAVGEPALSGLVFLGYPLQPPNKPRTDGTPPRAKHLVQVACPMLFVQGTRDAFGTPDDLLPLLPSLPSGTEIHPVTGGDHSFKVPKKTGTPQAEVLDAVKDAIARWIHARAA